MELNPGVVCVGDALVDLLTFVPVLPERGGAAWSPPPRRVPGGTAANVAVGLARLGMPVSLVGAVGDDADGRFLEQALLAHGVIIEHVHRHPTATTGTAIAMIEPDGERTFIACALAAAHTMLNDTALASLGPPQALFLTGLLLLEEPSRSATVRLAQRLQGQTRIYFDPNLRQPSGRTEPEVAHAMRAVAAASDVILAGDSEAIALELAPRPVQVLVRKRGAAGAQLETGGVVVASVAAFPVAVVDGTGAGDVFDAAFVAAHLRGCALPLALRVAGAAAALSITQPGAWTMPPWEEALALATG